MTIHDLSPCEAVMRDQRCEQRSLDAAAVMNSLFEDQSSVSSVFWGDHGRLLKVDSFDMF